MPAFVPTATGNVIDPTGHVTSLTMVTTIVKKGSLIQACRGCRGRSPLHHGTTTSSNWKARGNGKSNRAAYQTATARRLRWCPAKLALGRSSYFSVRPGADLSTLRLARPGADDSALFRGRKPDKVEPTTWHPFGECRLEGTVL